MIHIKTPIHQKPRLLTSVFPYTTKIATKVEHKTLASTHCQYESLYSKFMNRYIVANDKIKEKINLTKNNIWLKSPRNHHENPLDK